MKKTIAVLAVIAGLGMSTTGPAHAQNVRPDYGPAHTQRMGVPHWMTRSCATEDSVNCYWNARREGNGTGRSFYARLLPHTHGCKVVILYVKTADARVSDQVYNRC